MTKVKDIKKKVQDNRENIIQFLRDIVAIPSMDGQLKDVGERIQAEMRKLGFDEARFDKALEPFYTEYPQLVSTAEARRHVNTQITQTGERVWTVVQTLVDPEGDNQWAIHGEVELRHATVVEAPLVRLLRISS